MLWITGANGLLGSYFPKKNTICTGHLLDIAHLQSLQSFVQKNPQITKIVNCAAFTNVDRAEIEKEKAFQTNVIGSENMAIIAKEINVPFIHISTDYVFDGDGSKLLGEEDTPSPCNYYGKTKLEGEKRALDLGACVIRTSWVFGKGGKTFGGKLLNLLKTEKELHLTDDQWSRFTYAPDLVAAILKMFGKQGLYHFANKEVASRYEFGVAMLSETKRLGMPILTESILPVHGSAFPSPCKRPKFSALDTTKIEKTVLIRSWQEALKEFLCEN